MATWIRSLTVTLLVCGVLLSQPAGAQEGRPRSDGSAVDRGLSAAQPDKTLLDAIVKDLGLSLLSRSGETSLRVPLAPSEWTLSGVYPYAALSPRLIRPATDGVTGLAGPGREPGEDLSYGLGLGPGLRWRLSDQLDLFGEYLFRALPGTGVPAGSPAFRLDTEAPGLKGGFSIHF